MPKAPVTASYLLAALAVPLTLHFHLLPAAFAGLAVHVLTLKLAMRLPRNWRGWAHGIALAAIAVLVVMGLAGATLGIWSFLNGGGGMAVLLTTVAETLERLRQALPAPIAEVLPDTVDDLRVQVAGLLREHGRNISAAGMAGVRTFAHILLGTVIGGMTALHRFTDTEGWPPLSAALHARTRALTGAFDKVVFAQVKISALNTFLTSIYILVILPLCGIQLPLLSVIIPFTFVTGLLPVVGNLISNGFIILLSLRVSPGTALASTAFLIAIHKLEYFTNARIIGGKVHANAWELICAMMVMEALFGLPGLIAAPVVYAWLKAEMEELGLI